LAACRIQSEQGYGLLSLAAQPALLVDLVRVSSTKTWRHGRAYDSAQLAGRLLLALWMLAATPPILSAAESQVGDSSPANVEWAPVTPEASKYDWIELDSGEWLKGTIKLIQEDTVHFDSDKLDDLDFDWEDVTELITSQDHTLRFVGRRIVTGSARMRGNTIRVGTGDQVQEFKRSDLVSMVRGSGRELDYWSLNLSLGLSGQTGNTEQLTLNTSFDLVRETALTKTSLSYTGNVATQDSDISANNHRAVAAFNYYLTGRFFLVVPTIEAFQDEFQNIQLRLTPAAGLGYIVVDGRRTQLKTGFAAGYQATRFASVEEGDDTDGDVALQFSADVDFDLPKRFEWETAYQLQLIATDVGKTSQHLTSTFSFDLWGPLDLDTTFQWDWVADPTTDADGNTPEQNDFRISVGFGLDL